MEATDKDLQIISDGLKDIQNKLDKHLAVSEVQNKHIMEMLQKHDRVLFGDNGKSAVNGIARFNRILKEEARSRELVTVEIYPLSQRLCSQPKMFSDDGLHPSNLQYTKWLNSIFPKAFELLQKKIK